ncbi:hypothetical protein BpHYR1_004254 [Brachionus plicatilis]|uniref:Uncharacterized protein n=1 Tax=Brachionus plicatilis TaxID=10195 RepID=A0A3M7RU11_BRAPC|nr:hypothetical protein BpHYR1_004254 [Brachionus plicatilis]
MGYVNILVENFFQHLIAEEKLKKVISGRRKDQAKLKSEETQTILNKENIAPTRTIESQIITQK